MKKIAWLGVAAAVFLAAACSSGGRYPSGPYPTYTPQPTYTPYPPPRVTLHIVDDFFQESDIVVVKGTVITWTNDGANPHTASSTDSSGEAWDTGLLNPGQRKQHTFSRSGVFPYVCKVHEYMNGTIRVIE